MSKKPSLAMEQKSTASVFKSQLFKLGYFLSSRATKVSTTFGYFIQIVEHLQITSLCFSSRAYSPFDGSIFAFTFDKILSAFTLFPFADFYRPAAVYATYFCGILSILLLLTIFVCVFIRLHKHFLYVVVGGIFYVLYPLSTVMYIPFLGCILDVISCEKVGGDTVSYVDNSIKCYDDRQIYLIGIGFTTLCTFFALTFLCRTFVFSVRVSSRDPIARLDYIAYPFFHVSRTVLVAVLLLFPNATAKLWYILIEMLVTLGLYVYHLNMHIMYSTVAEKVVRLLHESNVWVVFVGIISYSTDEFSGAVIGALFCGWGLFVANAYLTHNFHDSLEVAITHKDPIRRCIKVMHLINRNKSGIGERIWEFSLQSYIYFHGTHCKIATCPLKLLIQEKKELERSEILETIAQMISRHIKLVIGLSPSDMNNRLYAIGYTIENTKNYMLALELIKATKKLEMNYLQSFMIKVYWKILKKKVYKAAKVTGGQSEVLNLIGKDKGQNQLCSIIEDSAVAREQFYDMLVDNDPAYEKFRLLGFSIKRATSQIKGLWKSLKKSNTRLSMKTLALYSEYYEQILLDPDKAAKIRSLMFEEVTVSEEDLLLQYAENGDAVVAVAGKGAGVITKHNGVMCELSGYTKEELVGMGLEKLIPTVYQEMHQAGFSLAILQAENEQFSGYSTKQTLIRHKAGHLVPVVLKVVALPNYTNGQCFIAKLSRDKANNSYNLLHILTDDQKNIVGMSPSKLKEGSACNILEKVSFDSTSLFDMFPELKIAPEGTFSKRINPYLFLFYNDFLLGYRSPKYKTTSIYREPYIIESECRAVGPVNGTAVGYYYKFWLPELAVGLDPFPTQNALLPAEYQFCYAPQFNAFYMTNSDTGSMFVSPRTCSNQGKNTRWLATISSKEENYSPANVEDQKPAELPIFYAKLVWTLEKFSSSPGILPLLNTVYKKPNYSKDVATFRLENGEIIKLQNNGEVLPEAFDPSCILGEDGEDLGHREGDSGNESIVRNAIKSRKNIKSTMKTLAYPTELWKLTLICFILFLAGVAIAITGHILSAHLYQELEGQVNTLSQQTEEYRCLMEADTAILQMVSVNE